MQTQKNNLRLRMDRNNSEFIRIEEKGQSLISLSKSWKGPCTTVNELNQSIEFYVKKESDLKKLLKTEIKIRKITSPNDSIERPNLFKLNMLTVSQLEQNFRSILSTKFMEIVEIPDEEEGLELIKIAFVTPL